MSDRRCIGFGSHEGTCTNEPGPTSKIWCDRCEADRRAYITKQLESISASFENPDA